MRLHQAINLTSAGAVHGGFWGALIGMIIMNPLLGAAVGAGAGALTGKLADIGIDDKFMKELGETLQPNTSALFVLVKEVTPDKVVEKLRCHFIAFNWDNPSLKKIFFHKGSSAHNY